MSKVHYAGFTRGNESDTQDYWDTLTACGLEVYEINSDITGHKGSVTCKNCQRVLEKEKTISNENTNKP